MHVRLYVPCVRTWHPWRSEAPMGGSPVTVVTDGGKLTCGPWEPSLGPVEEQQVFFPAEPPL